MSAFVKSELESLWASWPAWRLRSGLRNRLVRLLFCWMGSADPHRAVVGQSSGPMKNRKSPVWIGVHSYFGFDEMAAVWLGGNLLGHPVITHTVITAYTTCLLNTQDVVQGRI